MARTLINAHQMMPFSGSTATQAKFADDVYTLGMSMESGSLLSLKEVSFTDGGSIHFDANSRIHFDTHVFIAADAYVTGDIIIDDGGSLKEAGGVAALTFDGSGHITKIGQSTDTSGYFLKWDGSKAVWDAAALSGLGSTDNAILRANGTGGATAQGSAVTIDDSNNMAGIGTVSCGAITATGTSTFATACSPDAVDGATLGSTGAEWSDLYLADGGQILFGNDSEVTLGHVADSGLLMTSAVSAVPVFELKNTNDDATGATLKFNMNGASAADADVLGNIDFVGEDSANNATTYARILAKSDDVTSGEEEGSLEFYVAEFDGTLTKGMDIVGLGSNGNITVDITTHDGSAGGLKLGGTLVTSTAAELNLIDGVSAGTAAASKAVVLGSSKEIATIGTIGCGAITSTGTSTFGVGTFSGILKTDDATDATSTTDGSLQTDGGLSVAKDAILGNDVKLLSDSAVLAFGLNADTTLTHVADQSLVLNSSRALAFGDAGTYIHQVSDSYLKLVADGAILLASDTIQAESANSQDPLFNLKNTTNDANGARLQFTKDKGGAGADNDIIGQMDFVGDNDAQEQTTFAQIIAQVADASNGTEGGKIVLRVASHDGEMNNGIIIADGDVEDEVDITLGNGAASTVTIPGNLTVTGTTTTVNTVTMEAANAVVFEGATADGNETTLTIVDPDGDNTIYLPNAAGYIPLLADATTDAAAAVTAAEYALLDGGSTVGTTAVADGDGIFTNDGGTMKHTTVQTFQTYFDANSVGGTGMVTVGALDAGSITANFGAIDNGTSGIRSETITAESAFVPDANDGATLGTAALSFSDMYLADGGAILLGDDSEVTVTHVADVGLQLKHTATADNKPFILELASAEAAISVGEQIGVINFKAAGESSGTDAILVCAGIEAVAGDTFAADNNTCDLVFKTATSDTATGKVQVTSAGHLTPYTDDLCALGQPNYNWSDLYIADQGVIYLGDDQDVSLTHVVDTGVLLSSTDQLQFGDSGTYINQGADGQLDLTSDGQIDLNVGAAGVIVKGTTPKLTIGDAGAEDTFLIFDGNAQDFRIGIKDDIDVLEFGVGATHGTTPALKILSNASVDIATDLVVGDDLNMFSDDAVISFGADSEITLTHVADTGLTMAGAHTNGTNLRLNNTAGDGDARIEYQLGGTTVWSMGVEDGDSDKFVIEDGAGVLGADPAFEMAGDKAAKFFGSLEVGTLFKMPDVTAGKFLVGDGTSYQEVALSGDATLGSDGALTIAANSVQDSMVHDDVATGLAGNGLKDASGIMAVDFYVDRCAGSGGDNYTSATGVYALENSNLSGSEMVFLNGQMLHKASTDLLATGDYTCLTGSVELHPDLKLDSDDVLAVYYLK